MTTPVTVASLIQQGRAEALDPNLPKIYLSFNADFSVAATIEINLRGIPQAERFGIIRSIFIDNGTNPTAVQISVSGSNQTFTAPAQTQGFYTVNAPDKATITLTTVGGALARSTITLYNWDVFSNVWYSNGAIVTGAVAAYGPDAVGIVPTKPPLYMGVLDSTGKIIGLQLDAAGKLPVSFTSSQLPATLGPKTGALSLSVVPNTDTPFPITAAALPLPAGAATEATLAAAAASLSVIDDWDEADRAKVNPIVGQAGVSANSGAIDATTQRVAQGSITFTDYSITNMSGASQDVVTAGNGKNTTFLQALATNVGIVWFNLAGGAAVVGSGLGLAPGGTASLPGMTNKLTGIAATANDDITVYAG